MYNCTPHISLLHSFKRMPTVGHKPGYCASPLLCLFLTKPHGTTELWMILNRVGAEFQNGLSPRETLRDIWRNSDTDCEFFLHNNEHSSQIIWDTLETASSLRSGLAKGALQMNFMLPPANAFTIFSKSGRRAVITSAPFLDEYTEINLCTVI